MHFPNLVRKSTAEIDAALIEELTRCNIEVVYNTEDSHDEVNTHITGRTGDIKLTRAWNYWVATGPVHYQTALKIYHNPVGRTDIRIGGHCGCPSPDDYGIDWVNLATGKKVLKSHERRQCEKILANPETGDIGRIATQILAEFEFSDNPAEYCKMNGFANCYHIDSELGLYIFHILANEKIFTG